MKNPLPQTLLQLRKSSPFKDAPYYRLLEAIVGKIWLTWFFWSLRRYQEEKA